MSAITIISRPDPRLRDGGGSGSGGGSTPIAPTPVDPGESEAESPVSENNTAPSSCGPGGGDNPTTPNPVIIATGEKIKPELDFSAGSSYGLGLSRTYRSFNSTASMFGPRWMSDYDGPVLVSSGCYRHPDYGSLCIPQTATVTLPDGAVYTYTRTSSAGGFTYVAKGAAATGKFYRTSPYDNWVLTADKKRYTFSPAGVIQKVETLGGTTLLQYYYVSGSRYPYRVTNTAGQSIEFTWTSGRVTAVRDPAGKVWNYAYNGSGMLSTVTSPGSSPDIRTYHYENADPALLTGISINGVRYSRYAYHANKRVQVSGLENGEERDSFTYGTSDTTVTSAAGQPVTYMLAPK